MEGHWLVSDDFQIQKGTRKDGLLFPDHSEIRLAARIPTKWMNHKNAVVHIRVEAAHQPQIRLGLCLNSDEAPQIEFYYRILARCEVQVPFSLSDRALDSDMAFLPPWPGVFKGGIDGRPVSRNEVCALTLTLREPTLSSASLIGIHFTDEWSPENVKGDPLVDPFGQCKGASWDGKTKSDSELHDFLTRELEWARQNNRYPNEWSAYGGWTKKRFPATGWFHTAHDGRRWWLVDPDGCAFFSNGVCYGNRTGVYAMADHLEALYEWLPPRESETWTTGAQIPQYVVRNGLESAKTRRLVNFPRANMMRVFGSQWLEAWIDINAARMRNWGINTIGVGVNDYGDEPTAAFLSRAKIPYVVTLKAFPLTKQRIFRDFPDVFSDEYAALAARMARIQLAPYRNDPYLIGYFVTNEPEWLMYADVNLAERLLAAEGCEASKRALIQVLHNKYGDISNLNSAWNTGWKAFDELLQPQLCGRSSAAMQADLEFFHRQLIERYSRVVSDALRAVDPHHLNLGMRYNAASDRMLGQSRGCFDVFSFNCYGAEPMTSAAMVAKNSDMPMIVGEWHVGAMDSGLDAWGLYYTKTQAERARAISYYLEQSTQETHIVGTHYFEYNDQPYLGRFDGECYNIGLIDVCNRPYPRVADAFARFAREMYPMLAGEICPKTAPVRLYSLY